MCGSDRVFIGRFIALHYSALTPQGSCQPLVRGAWTGESYTIVSSWIAEGLGLRQELGDPPPTSPCLPGTLYPRGCVQGLAGRIEGHPLDVIPILCICVFAVRLLLRVCSFLMKLSNIYRSRKNSTRNPVYSTSSFNNY